MEPIRLKIKNFYAIADGEIDFTKFSSALILGAYENNILKSNGAGKSSILEALYWALFNDTRQAKKDDVIRWTTNETLVEFEFIFDRHIYKIIRRRSRISKESTVSLFTKEGNKWVNDSGSISTETNKKILTLLKIDDKIFLNSVYFKQHDIALFANSSPGNRKEIIKSIMKLDRWDEYQKDARNRLKFVKDNIEKQERIINENSNIKKDAILNNDSIIVINEELNTLQKKQKHIQTDLYSLLELKKEKNISGLIVLLDSTNNKINELKNKGKSLQNDQIIIHNQIEDNNEIIKKYAQQILSIESNVAILNEQINWLRSENHNSKELEDELLRIRVEAGTLKNNLIELNDTVSMVNIGQCQVCLSDINENNLLHIHESRNKKAKKLAEELMIVNDNLIANEEEYKKRQEIQEQLETSTLKMREFINSLDKAKIQKQAIDEDNVKLNNHSSIINTSLVVIIDQVKSYKIDVSTLEAKITEQKINNIDIQIRKLEEENIELTQKINAKSVEYGILLKEKEFITNKTEQVNEAIEMLDKFMKQEISYEQLVKSFGKEGIQAVFIESVVDELENYANETLAQICNEPTIIKLRTQKRTGDSWQETLEIDVVMNGFPQTFESLSGGERFRVSLALRIGLSEVLVKRAGGEIKLLLLDEVDSPLDAFGLQSLFVHIIKALEKRFKILVISHNDRIREQFDTAIMLTKTNNGSFINIM